MDIIGDRGVDFLFIDADHTYEGVPADYDMYSPLVAEKGLIALHDVLPHPDVPDVQVHRLWHELREGAQHLEFVESPDDPWGGIGVLFHGVPNEGGTGPQGSQRPQNGTGPLRRGPFDPEKNVPPAV